MTANAFKAAGEAREVTETATILIEWFGDEARMVAAKNATLRRFSLEGRRFWFRVWKVLSA